MSVLIKTMTKLPEHCYACPCHDGESGYCQADEENRYSDYRPFWCPLEMINEGAAINRNLCDFCINYECLFQSGMVRSHCDFYKAKNEHTINRQAQTDEEIKLGINIGDEVVSDYGTKGVVVGIDTYKGDVILSLLMENHKIPQIVNASTYKTKTGRYFPQIKEVKNETSNTRRNG